jgi:hypothetical protein
MAPWRTHGDPPSLARSQALRAPGQSEPLHQAGQWPSQRTGPTLLWTAACLDRRTPAGSHPRLCRVVQPAVRTVQLHPVLLRGGQGVRALRRLSWANAELVSLHLIAPRDNHRRLGAEGEASHQQHRVALIPKALLNDVEKTHELWPLPCEIKTGWSSTPAPRCICR